MTFRLCIKHRQCRVMSCCGGGLFFVQDVSFVLIKVNCFIVRVRVYVCVWVCGLSQTAKLESLDFLTRKRVTRSGCVKSLQIRTAAA